VIEKFGVPPKKVVDRPGLCGDAVDNVPAPPASESRRGAPDQRVRRSRHAPGPSGEVKQQKRRETLIEYADQIRLSGSWCAWTSPRPCPRR